MVHRVRVLEKQRTPSLAERLEARAARVIHEERDRPPEITELAMQRELAVVLSHINRLRNTDRTVTKSLMRHECYLGTEIIQREPREPVYLDPRLPERDRLRDRLREIDAERRRWRISYNVQMQQLIDRLATAISRCEQQTL